MCESTTNAAASEPAAGLAHPITIDAPRPSPEAHRTARRRLTRRARCGERNEAGQTRDRRAMAVLRELWPVQRLWRSLGGNTRGPAAHIDFLTMTFGVYGFMLFIIRVGLVTVLSTKKSHSRLFAHIKKSSFRRIASVRFDHVPAERSPTFGATR
jgi:hypothetical protein